MGRAARVMDADEIRQQLDRILGSKVFISAQRSQAFLRYVVERTILGNSPKEYEIAIEVFQRSADYDPTIDATVRVEASRLRSRLREYYFTYGKDDPVVIEVPKGGYTASFARAIGTPDLAKTVSPAVNASEPAPNIELSPAGLATEKLVTPGSHTELASSMLVRPGRRAATWVSAAVAIALFGALGTWYIVHRQRSRAVLNSIAVLPLQNVSADPAQEYFAAGMTDELTTALARVHGLRVVSHTSAALASRSQMSLSQMAEALNVDAVVEGSVLRSGNKVRITAQLIDARSDKHLWAQSFEGEANDIFSLQDSVADEIAAQTRVALTEADQHRSNSARVIRPEAYDDYLRGQYFVQRREGAHAEQYFRDALRLEPEYAAAWAGLARALQTRSGTEIETEALSAARRAVELDPSSGDGYIALGTLEFDFLWDWSAGERDLRKGISLSPGDPVGYTYLSLYLISLKRPAEAVATARRGVELDPLGFFANRVLGSVLFYDRQYQESLTALGRALEIAPDRSSYVDGWRADIFEAEGKYPEAVEADIRTMSSDLSAQETSSLRAAFSSGGWKSYQQALIRVFLPRASRLCTSYGIAMSYLELRDVPAAFRWFNRAADERCVFSLNLAADFRLDPFRQDPDYLEFQDRLKLPH